VSDVTDWTSSDKVFQSCGPAAANQQSLMGGRQIDCKLTNADDLGISLADRLRTTVDQINTEVQLCSYSLYVLSVLAKRLAGKSVSDMTYFVSSGTLNLNSVRMCVLSVSNSSAIISVIKSFGRFDKN